MQYKTFKVVYRRYAGLYFVFCVDVTDNELLYLETIHLFVEVCVLCVRVFVSCVCGGGVEVGVGSAARDACGFVREAVRVKGLAASAAACCCWR